MFWERGQEAMKQGQTDFAIECYRHSLLLDPSLSRNLLSLAAAHLEKGQQAAACPYLARYLLARPDHLVVRVHYAELLWKLYGPAAARTQLERFASDAQERPEIAEQHLVACHSRLMEAAQADEDSYGEHLHRGIGLFLLGKQRNRLPDRDAEPSAEGLLCRAAAELTLARLERPQEARPCWYLFEVWSELAQQQPATRWLRAAETAAPFSDLTPTEQRRLHLAAQALRTETTRK
jgi:predicted Zn-dependent protease